MRRILYTAIIAAILTSCNNEVQEQTQPSPAAVTDLQRDGLHGPVKKLIHEEYNAIQKDGQWLQGDSIMVRTEYEYDSTGTLLRAADIIVNGQQASTTREYKHTQGKPLTILSYELAQLKSHGLRQWSDDYHYTEKTFFNFDKNDTANWQILQQVTLNNNHLPEKFTSTLRALAGDTTYVNTAWLYYNADNHISKKILYNGTDSVTINYTTIEKDDKGNPTKTLKHYPRRNEAILGIDSYEYY